MRIDPQDVKRLAEQVPVVRSLLKDTPRYHMGSVLENRAGYQVARVLLRRAHYLTQRRPRYDYDPEYLRTIERDGILVIPDFLPQDQFGLVSSEFERIRETMEMRPFYGTSDDFTLRVAYHHLHKQPELTPHTLRYLAENQFIRQVAATVIRRPLHKRTIEPVKYQILDRVDRALEDDDSTRLHADIFFPTVKMFYYLSPVDESNAAFHYAFGSHHFSLDRLIHEYDLSIRAALIRAGRDERVCEDGKTISGRYVRPVITEAEKRRLGVKEQPIVGGANTLVIANTMGFHRRGLFAAPGLKRETLNISLRKRQSGVGRRLYHLKDLGKRPIKDIGRTILDR